MSPALKRQVREVSTTNGTDLEVETKEQTDLSGQASGSKR